MNGLIMMFILATSGLWGEKLWPDFFAVRGPREFVRDNLIYTNEATGSYEWFQGVERITLNNMLAYEAVYHGGLIIGVE
jgi:hypothetical protein